MGFKNLSRFCLSRFDGEEALKGEQARHFCNPITKNGSEVQDRHLQQSCAGMYSSTSHLVLHHFVNHVDG